ncbi:hypothetical protein [Mycobacterium sp.]|uniref:hypothetical protein n=1 Tax=Mycobacterium sp. TaxID=1785 RepID=UPI0025E20A86|nr:hypothetical protein [Mycobacterium sp.]
MAGLTITDSGPGSLLVPHPLNASAAHTTATSALVLNEHDIVTRQTAADDMPSDKGPWPLEKMVVVKVASPNTHRCALKWPHISRVVWCVYPAPGAGHELA